MKQRTFDPPIELEANRANLNNDPLESVTYQAPKLKKAFPGFFFLFKRYYKFTYESGAEVILKRNFDRMYSGQLPVDFKGLEFAPKGPKSKVVHKIVKIEELPEGYLKDGSTD